MHRVTEFERNRDSMFRAYAQVGVLELRLRSCLPRTFHNLDEPESKWFETLKLNDKGYESLNRAIKLSPSTPEDALSLSFWRYLLSSKNYGALWLPYLHKAFVNLDSPKSREAFLEIDKAMDTALRLRNNVAHYNLDGLATVKFSLVKVNWLIELLVEPVN